MNVLLKGREIGYHLNEYVVTKPVGTGMCTVKVEIGSGRSVEAVRK